MCPLETQVTPNEVVPPIDTPPPAPCSASVRVLRRVALQPYATTVIPCYLAPAAMFKSADVLLACQLEQSVWIPRQHPPAFGQLQIVETTVPSVSNFTVLVQNTSSKSVTILSGTPLAKATTVIGPPPSLDTRTDDIRLRPKYLSYISRRLDCDLHQYKQLFVNGGNFLQDTWASVRRAWINPPWTLLPQVIDKLLHDTPVDWILVCPKPRDPPLWYTALHQADNLVSFLLPRTFDTGYFYRVQPDSSQEPLPFPAWDVEIVRGNKFSFALLPPVLIHPSQQHTAFQTELPSWQSMVSLSDQFALQKPQLLAVLSPFESYLDGSRLGCTSTAECPIQLLDDHPLNLPQYRLSRVQQAVVDAEVAKMLQLGVREESISPWNSPILVIPKKDGTLRFCADLRQLNARTIKDVFPFPDLQQTLDKLGGKSVYTTLDLKSGYWQVPIPVVDRPKTAFSASGRHYQWCRAPFGFCNMPSIFQRMMSNILRDCSSFILVYLDDIIVFSISLEEHFQHLKVVLDKLVNANLTLHLKKCQFLAQSFSYLGHLLTPEGIRPNPDKVAALQQMSPPTNRKQLMQFLGLVNWFRRFIPQLSEMASALYPLVSKSTLWQWSAPQQHAFDRLKASLTSQSLVRFPDFSQPFVLVCDASDYQVGSVLLQQFGSCLHPIYYYSHLLDAQQRQYSVTEKECLAIVLSIKRFHVYLHGHFFIIRTDHRALVWLYRAKDQFSKLLRWSLFLQHYDFLIVYGKGDNNVIADALSRLARDETIPVDAQHECINVSPVSEALSDTDASHSRSPQAVPPVMKEVLPLSLLTFRNLQQTKTSGPRHENWLHRQVQVLGSWFTNNKGNHKQVYTMDVVDFIEGPTLRADRWKLRLQTPNEPDEYFEMSFSAMCKYLVPLVPGTADDKSQAPQAQTAAQSITLPFDLPSLDDFVSQQHSDPSLVFWFTWLEQNVVPSVTDSHHQWWIADKDCMFINEHGLLCRFAKFTTSTATRPCSQVVVPSSFVPQVLHHIHGSELYGHQGFSRCLFRLRSLFF